MDGFDLFLIAYGTLAVPSCFLFGCFSLLPGGSRYRLGYFVLIAIFVNLIFFSRLNPAIDAKAALATGAPLIAFWVYGAMRWLFIKLVGRPPVDVFFNIKKGLGYDRIFAMVVFLGLVYGTFGSFIFLGILVWGSARA